MKKGGSDWSLCKVASFRFGEIAWQAGAPATQINLPRTPECSIVAYRLQEKAFE